ncbi:MAG: glycosyltransferase [Rhodothermaceae bacterium]|nr:glycosyltransferase [Rhodothermaceae bacterium]MXX57577.1 glycosyltransferase [Rhodothermaceae bacterium]MXZ04919.1 glycosyltransferase [Rhodothermaceae bacterium]MYD20409.1 glycosyltransferase [Rhodothermaceae bacterium]MYD56334.1 glycosyltransferase [Rhodothermaceae bacterium]
MGSCGMTGNQPFSPAAGAGTSSEPLKVSVIIVNYNVRDLLRQALRSVNRSLADIPAEIIVIDNNSVDGSVGMLREEFPEVVIIANRSNVGFSAANNQAIREAGGEYLFILNPDTIVEEDTISVLTNFMDTHPDAGAMGCRILNPDGTFALESRRSFPTPEIAFYRMIGLSRLFPRSKTFGRYNLTFLPQDEVAKVDALSGSCMFVRSTALTGSSNNETDPGGAGLFDEKFFMYGEDLDLCYRIQKAGWAIYYTPETQIIHYKGESTKKGDLRYVRLFHSAMARFARKHLSEDYPKAFLWVLHLAVVVRGLITALGNTLRHTAVRDWVLCVGVVAALGLFRSVQTGTQFMSLFYWGLSPLFALITTGVIAASGGYRARKPYLGLVFLGLLTAVTALAALSFFVKQIAFSRAVVIACLPACMLVLSAVRLIPRTRQRLNRRTLIAGNLSDADLQAVQQMPQYTLVGIATQNGTRNVSSKLPHFGDYDQLRDIVRVHDIQSIIFASASLTNKKIFALMQQLAGLPVQTHIVDAGQDHMIGKTSIEKLGKPPVLEAEDVIGALRSHTARRVSDILAALAGAIIHPVVWLAAKMAGPRSRWMRRSERTSQWRAVLRGQLPLIGFHEGSGFIPPAEWQLQPGVFAVSEMLGPNIRRPTEETEQAYWYYVRNQSAVLDWFIAIRALRAPA